MKILGVCLFVILQLRSRLRVEAIVGSSLLCLGYLAMLGSVKTVLGGGGEAVVGYGLLQDRNQFAVALVSSIPLIMYFYRHNLFLGPLVQHQVYRYFIIANIFAFLISAMGGLSRTGLVVGIAVGTLMLAQTKRKMRFLIAAGVVVGLITAAAPDAWFARMGTLVGLADEDEADVNATSSGRVQQWQWAIDMWLNRPIIGNGFAIATVNTQGFLEAHNTTLELLSQHGIVGLALFSLLVASCVIQLRRIKRMTRNRPDLQWAHDLSDALFVSLMGYCVGSQFLSIAIYPMFYDAFAAIAGLWTVVSLAQSAAGEPSRLSPRLEVASQEASC